MRYGILSEFVEELVSRTTATLMGGSKETFKTLFDRLLREQGDIPALKTASVIISRYGQASLEEKRELFTLLAEDFDVDADKALAAAQAYRESRSAHAYATLQAATESPRQEQFRRLNRVPGGTLALVRMREDLLFHFRDVPGAKRIDSDFQHLFSSWFNRGFLVLRNIDWTTPAHILEKIIAYEAVHEISSWADLRSRTEPADRRCFAYFHPAVPDEPLVFVEVALTQSMPAAISDILDKDRVALAPGNVTTAVFYSISNCHQGLQGVSFGNFLIKQVAAQLQLEFPRLKDFVTLSPVPGFSRWLASAEPSALAEFKKIAEAGLLDAAAPLEEEIRAQAPAIRALAATYLLLAKRADSRPFDPVARFHLANGAELARINTEANLTARGISESLGVMVNYRYELARADANHEQYFATGSIRTPRQVRELALKLPVPTPEEVSA
ncbi:MAG: malonyl-CoA decarboxylase family protein [Rhizobiaceae bacterium]